MSISASGRASRFRGRPFAVLVAGLLLLATAPQAVAAAPSNDLVGNATALSAGVAMDFNSAEATISASDPTDCDGSHGQFPGPYFASVWFSYTARSAGQLHLTAETMQNVADDFLAISFVYQQTASGLSLVDCTAFGNDATWYAKSGQTFLIAELGLSSTVTDDPDFSDKGGHGTIVITRTANEAHYSFVEHFTDNGCDPATNVVDTVGGLFRLNPRHGDPTPYLFDNYESHTLFTNPENGKWFRIDHNGLYRDLHITNVEGTIYTFVSQETGRPFTLTAMDGTRIFFDRGRLLTTFQVDTQGDDDLSNDEFIEGSWQLLAENGDHPAFFFDGDFCEIVHDLLS